MCASTILCCVGELFHFQAMKQDAERSVLARAAALREATDSTPTNQTLSQYLLIIRHVADHCVTVCGHCCVFRL